MNVLDSAYRVTPVVVDFGDTLYVGFYVTDRATSEVVAARRTTVYRAPPEPGGSSAEETQMIALAYADSLARCRQEYKVMRDLASTLQERLIEALAKRDGQSGQ